MVYSFVSSKFLQSRPYQAGTYLRVVNVGGPIPCTLDKFKEKDKQRVVMTILGVCKVGSSYAPFKAKAKGKDGKSVRDKSAMPPSVQAIVRRHPHLSK